MRKFLLLPCLTAAFAFANSESWAQSRRVTGKITSSEDGLDLPGVNVALKGTTEGTVSDAAGNYALEVPQTGGISFFHSLAEHLRKLKLAQCCDRRSDGAGCSATE